MIRKDQRAASPVPTHVNVVRRARPSLAGRRIFRCLTEPPRPSEKSKSPRLTAAQIAPSSGRSDI